MEPQQFSLRWNNFQNNLSAGFETLWKEEDLVDVTLAVEGKYLKAHKMVLSICSPYFKELFRNNPCKHPIIILHEVNYNALHSILQFIYQGEVRVKHTELATFMKVAEALKVKGLTETDPPGSSKDDNKLNGLGKDGSAGKPKLTAKKPSVKSIQNVKNQERRSASNSPTRNSPAPAKMIKLEEPAKPSNNKISNLPVTKIKEEPVDPSDFPETLMKVEPESSSGTPPFPSIDNCDFRKNFEKIPPGADTSNPGTLQCIIGRRGLPRLIVDGYTFYKKSTYKNKCFWYCKSNKTHKCAAVCWSVNGLIVKWPEAHTHEIIPEVIIPGEDKIVPIELLTKTLIECARRTGPELMEYAKMF